MIASVARWISIIGTSLNILLLTHRTLRHYSCSWFVAVAACFDLLTLDHALPLRILADGFHIDVVASSSAHCCIRFYTRQICSFVPITLICLATSDRWAVSMALILPHSPRPRCIERKCPSRTAPLEIHRYRIDPVKSDSSAHVATCSFDRSIDRIEESKFETKILGRVKFSLR